MAREVLVDSSIYITWSRGGPGIIPGLLYLATFCEVVLCGPVLCEVGRGLRDIRLREQIRNYWGSLVYVPTDNCIWEEAEDLLWQLDRRGKKIPLPDAVIACCARRADAVIYTHDQHFDLIPDVRVAHRLQDL